MKLSEVVAAAERGEAIEWRFNFSDWGDKGPNIPWYPHYEYRVKPEPLEFWVNTYEGGVKLFHRTAEGAKAGVLMSGAPVVRVAVHVKEVA